MEISLSPRTSARIASTTEDWSSKQGEGVTQRLAPAFQQNGR